MTLKKISKLPFQVRYIRTTVDNNKNMYDNMCLCINGRQLIDLRHNNCIQHYENLSDLELAKDYYMNYPKDSWEPCSKYGDPIN